jgi:hypothetical protein
MPARVRISVCNERPINVSRLERVRQALESRKQSRSRRF